ncbi:hypothetical protein ABZ086_34120, partial [Streptomyces halstedii]
HTRFFRLADTDPGRTAVVRTTGDTSTYGELAAYWAGHRTPDTGPHPTEPSAALIAALLTADLIAWATGEPHRGPALPARRRLRRIRYPFPRRAARGPGVLCVGHGPPRGRTHRPSSRP